MVAPLAANVCITVIKSRDWFSVSRYTQRVKTFSISVKLAQAVLKTRASDKSQGPGFESKLV